MSCIFLALRANTKRLIRIHQCSFHTPFAVLGSSPLRNPLPTIASQYEKQYDHASDPITSHTGYRTYVVSEPDPATKHYQVPAGAYPTSAPYTNFTTADESNTKGVQYTSTGGEQIAHGPTTTRPAPHHYGYASAPGEMGARGGGYGGMKLMDRKGTIDGQN